MRRTFEPLPKDRDKLPEYAPSEVYNIAKTALDMVAMLKERYPDVTPQTIEALGVVCHLLAHSIGGAARHAVVTVHNVSEIADGLWEVIKQER
jgi:hypothetical protein